MCWNNCSSCIGLWWGVACTPCTWSGLCVMSEGERDQRMMSVATWGTHTGGCVCWSTAQNHTLLGVVVMCLRIAWQNMRWSLSTGVQILVTFGQWCEQPIQSIHIFSLTRSTRSDSTFNSDWLHSTDHSTSLRSSLSACTHATCTQMHTSQLRMHACMDKRMHGSTRTHAHTLSKQMDCLVTPCTWRVHCWIVYKTLSKFTRKPIVIGTVPYTHNST